MAPEPAVRLEGAGVPCIAFDLDGTIYFGETLAEGAERLLDRLRAAGVDVVFFTNNSMKTRASVIEKLVRMGVPATRHNTYTSGSAVGGYLRENGIDRVAVVGSEGLVAELESRGVAVLDSATDAQALVVGLIPGFDFAHRPEILDGLPEVPIIAANMDMTYPVENGELRPGCGAIVRSVEEWTGRHVDQVVGKPGVYMLDLLCREHGFARADVVVVGDSLDSDIAMARNAGCRSVLIDSSGAAAGASGTNVVPSLDAVRQLLFCPTNVERGEGSRP